MFPSTQPARNGTERSSAAPRGFLEEDVRLAARGDGPAFERLVLRHQDDVVHAAYYYLGNRDDAVDVAQEAFLKAYRGIAGFRGGASFRTWVLTIALNCARSLRTRQHARKRSAKIIRLSAEPAGGREPGEGGQDVPDPEVSSRPAAMLERKELKEAIERAIQELEEPARRLIVLRDIGGESYEAIAEATGLPLGTVKSRIHRARLELQEKLGPWVQ